MLFDLNSLCEMEHEGQAEVHDVTGVGQRSVTDASHLKSLDRISSCDSIIIVRLVLEQRPQGGFNSDEQKRNKP